MPSIEIYLGHDCDDLAADPFAPNCLLDDGVTFNLRFRLTPPDQVVDFAKAGRQAPDGTPIASTNPSACTTYKAVDVPETIGELAGCATQCTK